MEKTAFPNDLLSQVLTELLQESTLWRGGRVKPNPTVVALLGRGFCTARHAGRVGITTTQTLSGLSGLPMAFKPNPAPISFGKPCYSLPNIPLQGWDFPQQLQCHIPVTSSTQAVLAVWAAPRAGSSLLGRD